MRTDHAARAVASLAAVCAAMPALAQIPATPDVRTPSVFLPPAGVAAQDGTPAYEAPWPSAVPTQTGRFDFPYNAMEVPQEEPTPGWTVRPSISLDFLATDNYYDTRRDHRSEFITTISPGILVTADTQRVRGIVSYQPSLELHAYGNGSNGIYHNLNGQALLTLAPSLFYLDLRGSASVQDASGGQMSYGPSESTGRQSVQTTSFQVSPYFLHRFSGTATVQVGYAFQSVTQNTRDDGNVPLAPNGRPYFVDQNFTANEFYGAVRSGEEFGRLALEGRVISTDYDGTGVMDGAFRRIAAIEARYAITRMFSVLGEIGYERQEYNGFPPIRISDMIWSGGGKLTFSQDSFIIAKYGHHDGFDSLHLDASLLLGGRTRLFANYSESLTTSSQRSADLLNTTTLDELGNPVDLLTGSPSILPLSNSLLGIQNGLMKIRTGSVSVSQNWDRDTFTLTLLREERTPVSVDIGTFSTKYSGTSGSLTWTHALTPATTMIGFAQYGNYESPARGSGDVYSLGASLVTELMPGLAATVQLTTSSRSDDVSGGRSLRNTIIAGLRKTF